MSFLLPQLQRFFCLDPLPCQQKQNGRRQRKSQGVTGHVVIVLTLVHSLPRAQSRQSAKLFLKSTELGLHQPLTRRQVCPPLLVPGGGACTRWRERGWESPNSDEWTYTVVLCKYTYFVTQRILAPIQRIHSNTPTPASLPLCSFRQLKYTQRQIARTQDYFLTTSFWSLSSVKLCIPFGIQRTGKNSVEIMF